MLKRSYAILTLMLALAAVTYAQNSNSSTTRQRTTSNTNTARPTATPAATRTGQEQDSNSSQTGARRTGGNRAGNGATDPTSKGVLAAFNALLDGIRAADVDAVTGVYLNSPQLLLFNNNGTITKGWEQMRKNRESSYPEMKDVKLDARVLNIQMFGREGAVVMASWTQSQTFRGASETASGRMTLVFRRVGNTWKAIHLHTSPDAPDPSRVLPSEQTPATTAPTQKPKTTP
jgi:ketosteroid isomerase-like protein